MKFLFDEQVLCRMMGYTGPSEILKDKSFGPGRGPIWVDQLGCSGTESSLLECSKLPWAKHNCNHTEDAGIRCSEAPRTEKVNFNSNEFNCIKRNDIFVLIAYNNRSTESRRQRVTGLAGDFGLRSSFGWGYAGGSSGSRGHRQNRQRRTNETWRPSLAGGSQGQRWQKWLSPLVWSHHRQRTSHPHGCSLPRRFP